MSLIKSKKISPEINIYNIIKPVRIKKNEKIILVVGKENEVPPESVWEELKTTLKDIGNYREVMIPTAIKLYIVSDDSKIELYRGDKIEK